LKEENVYFGVGCFWHIQFCFIQAERDLLQRGDKQLTSLAGYAGGKSVGNQGQVCYHNMQFLADYGRMGHGEVVGMSLPSDQIVPFAKVYFSLFDPRTKGAFCLCTRRRDTMIKKVGESVCFAALTCENVCFFSSLFFLLLSPTDRVDPLDRGPEYRSLIGLPGGVNHPSYAGIEAAAQAAGFKLKPGKGNDPDTLGQQLVFVYDTAKFPFYQAEVYHQYHNDFQSPNYGKAYNDLAQIAFEEGRIKTTGCPDRV
jgi:peptide methionine sulfoxide reductase MsrA